MFLLQPLTFSESLTEGELLLPRYIRPVSLHLISWIALTLHQLMDQSPPGMTQTLAMTFLHSQIGLSCSKFRFCTTTVLFHWSWFCEALLHYIRTISLHLISWIAFALHQLMASPLPGFLRWQFYMSTSRAQLGLQQIHALHYISTTSLRLILWIAFALHPYFFTDSSAVQDHFREIVSHELGGDKSGNYKPHPICFWRPVTWPEAKPKTSRYNYGKRLSRQTSRFFSNYGKRLSQ